MQKESTDKTLDLGDSKFLQGKNKGLREIIEKQKKNQELSAKEEIYLAQEKRYWSECNNAVEENAATFIKVGLALAKIKDRELHKLAGMSFEAYLAKSLGVSRAQGDRLINGAQFAEEIKKMTGIPVSSENHVRQLLPMRKEGKVAEAAAVFKEVYSEAQSSKVKFTGTLLKKKAVEKYSECFPKSQKTGKDRSGSKAKTLELLKLAIQTEDKDEALKLIAQL